MTHQWTCTQLCTTLVPANPMPDHSANWNPALAETSNLVQAVNPVRKLVPLHPCVKESLFFRWHSAHYSPHPFTHTQPLTYTRFCKIFDSVLEKGWVGIWRVDFIRWWRSRCRAERLYKAQMQFVQGIFFGFSKICWGESKQCERGGFFFSSSFQKWREEGFFLDLRKKLGERVEIFLLRPFLGFEIFWEAKVFG